MTEFNKQMKLIIEDTPGELPEDLRVMQKTLKDMEFRLRELEVDATEYIAKAKEAKRNLRHHKDVMLNYMFAFNLKKGKKCP